MKKVISSLITICMLMGMVTLAIGAKAQTQNAPKFLTKLPYYQQLSLDLVENAKEKGINLKGKEAYDLIARSKSYSKPAATEALQPLDVRGLDHKGIAILVDFPLNSDNTSAVPGVNYERIPQRYFDDLLNGDTYNPYEMDIFKGLANFRGQAAPIDRTMKNYYTEVSYGQFKIDVKVIDWVTLPKPYEYYLGQNKPFNNENGDALMAELIQDAIDQADENVDFADYAIDAKPGDFWLEDEDVDSINYNGEEVDKVVPQLFIIHRGTGAEYNVDPNIIWSHQFSILGAQYRGKYLQNGDWPDLSELKYKIADGVLLNEYNIVPEVTQDITGYYYGTPDAPGPAYVGVYSHEFGHVLGLPDQYDYGYDSQGTGYFSLMASGSSGRNINNYYYSGNTPTHMDAWSKYYLGFIDPIRITQTTKDIVLRPVEDKPDIYRIDIPGSNGREYFLLENRQLKGYDNGLTRGAASNNDLHGLVVYHVLEDIFVRNMSRPNEAQNNDPNHLGKAQQPVDDGPYSTGETHYAISVIQADGKYELEDNKSGGNATDVFPGRLGINSIDSKGNISPNTTSVYKWDTKGTYSGISIDNIIESQDGTITLDVNFNN